MFRHIIAASAVALMSTAAFAQTDPVTGVTRAEPGDIVEANTPNQDRLPDRRFDEYDRRFTDFDTRLLDMERRLEAFEGRYGQDQAGVAPGAGEAVDSDPSVPLDQVQ